MKPHFAFDSDDLPWNDPRRAAGGLKEWLARHLRESIRYPQPMSDAVQDAVVAILCSRAGEVLTWQDSEVFYGEDYENGGWKLNMDAVKALLPSVLTQAQRDADTQRFPTLDAYLAALHADELEAPSPIEPRALHLVADPKAFRAMQRSRRVSCACGARFVRKAAPQRLCPDCLTKARDTRAANAEQDAIALRVGAKYLAALLEDFRIDPFAFPSGKPYDWMTHDLVRSWLAGSDAPATSSSGHISEYHWGLDKKESRMLAWAFRRPSAWHRSIREELTERLREYGIEAGGTDA